MPINSMLSRHPLTQADDALDNQLKLFD